MKTRKTSEERVNEFASKSCIKKKFGDITLSNSQKLNLKEFFDYIDQIRVPGEEIIEATYITAYRILIAHPTSNLVEKFKQLRHTKKYTLEHFKILFGDQQGGQLYSARVEKLKVAAALKPAEVVDSFLNKSRVSTFVNKQQLSSQQLVALTELLTSRPYKDFADNETIVVDLLLTYSDKFNNLIERFDRIKSLKYGEFDYFVARYGESAHERYTSYKKIKSESARSNFSNCVEYWLLKGLSEEESIIKSVEVQQDRASRNTSNTITCRNVQFWTQQGYTEEEAISRIKQIQCRDLNFYVFKYGQEEGLYRFEKSIKTRLETWYSKTENERILINKSKGRTYADLVNQYGVDVASNIINSRLRSNSGISEESKKFFIELDSILGHTLENKSVTGHKGPEYWINSGNNFYLVDYKIDNCIIEYHGSYWHADKRMFSANDWHSGAKKYAKDIWDYDAKKIDTLKRLGYNTLVVWSKDVVDNRNNVLTKCKDFINEYCNPCKTSN